MIIENLTIGADPELFLEKDGKVISAEGLIGGSKDNPKEISEEGHAVQEDNVMVEFNIPPSTTKQEFIHNINYPINYIKNLCELYGDIKISKVVSAELEPKYINTSQAKKFGCEIDLNAYTKANNPRVINTSRWRSAGGHLHYGWDNPNTSTILKMVFAMDMTLGLQSVLMDNDTIRKKWYGRAGDFRQTHFGFEYRTLSNFWIQSNQLIEWAYETIIEAVNLVNTGEIDLLLDLYKEEVRDCINNHDKEKAKQLLNNIETVLKRENTKQNSFVTQ